MNDEKAGVMKFYMQLVMAHFAAVRATVNTAALVLSVVGLLALFAGHCDAALMAWAVAFACKSIEAILLDKALVEAQLELEDR